MGKCNIDKSSQGNKIAGRLDSVNNNNGDNLQNTNCYSITTIKRCFKTINMAGKCSLVVEYLPIMSKAQHVKKQTKLPCQTDKTQ